MLLATGQWGWCLPVPHPRRAECGQPKNRALECSPPPLVQRALRYLRKDTWHSSLSSSRPDSAYVESGRMGTDSLGQGLGHPVAVRRNEGAWGQTWEAVGPKGHWVWHETRERGRGQ